jgi:hypothetical protein
MTTQPTTDKQDEETRQSRNVFLLEAVGWKKQFPNFADEVTEMWCPPGGITSDYIMPYELPDLSWRESACYREDLRKHLATLPASARKAYAEYLSEHSGFSDYGKLKVIFWWDAALLDTDTEAFLQAAYSALRALEAARAEGEGGEDKIG